MKTNVATRQPIFTHEGGPSTQIPPIERLKRLSMACMLWEDTFYVDGKTVADQIVDICTKIDAKKIVEVALEAYSKGHLRHLPLYLILQALKKGGRCKEAIAQICNRPDQMTELLSLYWKDGKKPLPAQLKRGLALAFTQFDAYQLAKYNRDTPIKLRDILFLCHAKPKDDKQAETWKQLISNTLPTPETWEVKLSAGEDKKESFQELLEKSKMGKLAIVRNLRNMFEAGVPHHLVERELLRNGRPILPFQYLSAAKACPQWERTIDYAMVKCCMNKEKLEGVTILLVDVSGSMTGPVSGKSTVDRMDAACGIAILLREICPLIDIFTFSEKLAPVPLRSGMALRDAIVASQHHGGTLLGEALQMIMINRRKDVTVDRIIVITDEQASDSIPRVDMKKCYIVNIAPYQNGIESKGQWLRINGFSEHVVDYIVELEKDETIQNN